MKREQSPEALEASPVHKRPCESVKFDDTPQAMRYSSLTLNVVAEETEEQKQINKSRGTRRTGEAEDLGKAIIGFFCEFKPLQMGSFAGGGETMTMPP
ncbi:hypothetical protein GOP47_0028554, partial [Adiantum capillus-veneris]